MQSNILVAARHVRYTSQLSSIDQVNSLDNDSDIIMKVKTVVTSMTEQKSQLSSMFLNRDTDMKCHIIHVSFITLTTAEVMYTCEKLHIQIHIGMAYIYL